MLTNCSTLFHAEISFNLKMKSYSSSIATKIATRFTESIVSHCNKSKVEDSRIRLSFNVWKTIVVILFLISESIL